MNEIKPIETIYNGHRFRSRLEARYAVFFDTLGIKYMYEIEGFKLPNGDLYLPDFYLPDCDTWFEVKGVMTLKDKTKIEQFAESCGKKVVVGYDDFTFALSNVDYGYSGETFCSKERSHLAKCNNVGRFYFYDMDGDWSSNCKDCSEQCDFQTLACGDGWANDCVKSAIKKALQARFEHGERG